MSGTRPRAFAIVRTVAALQRRMRAERRSVGFVPTMGALHAGHLSLVRRARRENKVVVVSIFVNPAQFGPKEDLKKYPRPFARDVRLCREAGADIVFAPQPADMYPSGYRTSVEVAGLSDRLCGASRPGHFRGVATVVAKLFNIVLPARAYFGLKDLQQVRVIERMVRDLNMPVRVVACPTVREPSGLALSSRNRYLSATEKAAAAAISRALQAGAEMVQSSRATPAAVRRLVAARLRRIPGARPDYVAVVHPDTLEPLSALRGPAAILCAVRVGPARLIDNIVVAR